MNFKYNTINKMDAEEYSYYLAYGDCLTTNPKVTNVETCLPVGHDCKSSFLMTSTTE